jgi:peptide/nickel transport system substrate-binding protein
MRAPRMVAVLAILALLAAACGGGGNDQSGAASSAITIAIGAEPTTLDPQVRDDGNERAVNDNIYETLMTRDAAGELQPGLATAAPTRKGEETWEFKLRPDIKFSNGEPFNADAVVASVTRVIDPKLNSEQASFFSTITGATKVDDLTVTIETKGPDPLLPSRMYWMKMVPAQYSSEDAFADKPAGTGPYQLKEWSRGTQIVLEPNPNYWGTKPPITQVTYKFVPEGGARQSGLLAGEYDLITNLLPEDVERAPKSAHLQGLEHPMIILNARGSITQDERVRQALNHAVDKQALASQLFGGLAKVDTCQILSPQMFGYNPSLQPYAYDLEKAKSLLQEAGVVGKQIELVGETGRWLKDKVSNYDFDTYLKHLFQQPNRPDAIFVSSSNELLDADRQYSNYYADGGSGASNSDPQLKRLITEARTNIDEGSRLQQYQQAGKLACDKAYFTFLLNNEDIYGMSERLNWQPRVDAKLLVSGMSTAQS